VLQCSRPVMTLLTIHAIRCELTQTSQQHDKRLYNIHHRIAYIEADPS
jgi:hypothetical protein